jgi:RHH-type proline utilization regulon transcriptional repressor/proline dehydrogenase/delta 1-pyrroline-5-carboxylate dehydrogenase
VLAEPEFVGLDAGIVLQAYLPDSHDVMSHLGEWAATRRASGGGRIKVRLVKGANLAMEAVEAALHGWVQAPYPTKADVDASYKLLLENALNPAWADAVRVGVASHNLFDVAWALVLRDELQAAERMEIEMLEGMAPAQARAVARRTGTLLMYAPVVRRDELDASISYLSRRLDENTAPENFLRALFTIRTGTPTFEREADRFRKAVMRRHEVITTPLRRLVEIDHRAVDFENEPDSDLTSAVTRMRVAQALSAATPITAPRVETIDGIDAAVATAAGAVAGWAARSFGERRGILQAVADQMAMERFDSIACMAVEAGKTVAEADPEISEGIDFARYYATAGVQRLELAAAAGHRVTARGVVVVAAPWNFPYAIPAGGVFAALMAGNAVIVKPAPETVQTAWLLANQCWRAGVPTDVLQFVACPDSEVGQRLITHPRVDTVVLTGAYDTAQLFLGWKPSLRVLAETSGKNAIVVTAAADVDAAIRDVVRSAFGHAGQKCSAASLCIVEAAIYDDPSFLARLAETVRSIRVGEGVDPATMTGPLIAAPRGNLLRALTSLEPGERWLVEPLQLDDSGRLWSPGVRTGVKAGSWFHMTECFGPVLGVMRAPDLDAAIAIQNATPYGLTGGLQSLDPAEIDRWLDRVEVGNAYVNRHITGAIVQRQPFGGWKRSSIGGAPKAGGPGYVAAFARVGATTDTHDVVGARASFAAAWRDEFGVELDRTGIAAERNGLRSRPLPGVVVRFDVDATATGSLALAEHVVTITGTPATWSAAETESDGTLIGRLATLRPAKLRALCSIGDELRAACHRLDITVDESPMSGFGPIELPRWLREQSISETRHRYGRLLTEQ